MRAVLTVIGKDTVGILARVSAICAEHNVNITEVTQSVLSDLFCMIMLCETDKLDIGFADFADKLEQAGKGINLSIKAMHEDIFNSMHRI